MNLLRTLKNVAANLRDGVDPAAVRTDVGGALSPDCRERMQAVEQTERYIASLAWLPQALRQELCRCVAQVSRPLLSAEALAAQVAARRQALAAAIGRGGQAPTADELQQLARWDELQRALQRAPPDDADAR